MAPNLWKKVGRVINLNNFPLKSGYRIELNEVEVTRRGFLSTDENLIKLRDRSFLIYDKENAVGKSARDFNRMLLIKLHSHDRDRIVLYAPGMGKVACRIPSRNPQEQPFLIKFQSWSDETVPTLDCGDAVASWITKFLLKQQTGLRLGYYDDSFQRTFDQWTNKDEMLRCYNTLTNDAFGLFADLASVSLFNYRSFLDLNEKLENKITVHQFRPNIVVDGDELEAFSEDTWEWVKIGEVIFKKSQECTRCQIINLNSETGDKNPNKEPYCTLFSYRNSTKGPRELPSIGIYLEVETTGIIHVEDEVCVGKECPCTSKACDRISGYRCKRKEPAPVFGKALCTFRKPL